MFICAALRLELKSSAGGLLSRRSHCHIGWSFSIRFPHRPAVNGEHETRVAHHSTRPSRKPERPGLSLESGRKDTVSSRVRGARIWCLSVLSELPGKSAFMRPKGSAIQVDDGEDCTPIKVRLLLQFETGRGALILAMSGPSPGLPNTFQAQEQDFFPL